MSRWFKTAIACGSVPLTVGTSVYIGWRWTQWNGFIFAGYATLCFGLLAFVVGILCLQQAWLSDGDAARRGRVREYVFAGGLLFSNFPVAAYYVLSFIDVSTRYTVHTVNDGNESVERVTLHAPGVDEDLGSLEPGSSVVRHFHFTGDGKLEFRLQTRTGQTSGQIEGYVTSGMRGDVLLRIKAHDEVEINLH